MVYIVLFRIKGIGKKKEKKENEDSLLY
jgi:hypothetical protein